MNLKQQLEVLLFSHNKPLSLKTLSEITGQSSSQLKKALSDLTVDYAERDSALEITFQRGGYLLSPQEEFLHLTQGVLPINIKTSLLRTIALIALKEPVVQSKIIKERGSSAYEHIRHLLELGWLKREEQGLSYLLSTTSQFKKHFNLSSEARDLREQLLQIEKQAQEQLIAQEKLENQELENRDESEDFSLLN